MTKHIFTCLLIVFSLFAPDYITMQPTSAVVVYAEKVAFNTKTHKVHKLSCVYTSMCTVNCIIIERKEAYRRGGIPCKVCGG